MDESRFCTRCGALATPENVFCGKCGAPFGSGEASPASSPPGVSTPVTEGPVSKRSTSRGKPLAAILAAIVVIATLAGVGYYAVGPGGAKPSPTPSPTPSPITHVVTGALVLSASSSITAIDSFCQGTGGYSDLSAGASVILRDENDTILASTSLDPGSGSKSRCSFSFTLPDVSDTAKFYAITISHRGTLSYSHDKMVALGWVLSLSIG